MEDFSVKIGERVRKIRNERGLTLQDVANFTGFSKALISQIENNVVMPPINTLSKIANVLNVKMTYFFEDELDYKDYYVVRADERKYVFREGVKHGYMYEGLAQMKDFDQLEMCLVTIKPAQTEKKLFNHEGYEYIIVKDGEVNLYLNNDVLRLKEGDSIAFNSQIPHYVESVEQKEAKIISAILKIGEIQIIKTS